MKNSQNNTRCFDYPCKKRSKQHPASKNTIHNECLQILKCEDF